MLLELFIALLLGILAGTFTGLSPGIHINLISVITLSFLSSLSNIPLIVIAVFIVSMSITHTFLDFIPSILLGAPEEDSFLAILPGHEMLLKGQGYQALILTIKGSLASIPIILIFTPLFILFLPKLYTSLLLFIPFLLIFVSFYSIFREKNPLIALIIFLLAGFLGYASFALPIKEPLLPLLTGLFGLSSLFISLKQKTRLKKQKILPLSQIRLPKKEYFKSFLASFISAPLCSFLPGIGSSHAAFISSEIVTQNKKGFLFLVGSLNTIIMALSFVAIYSIGRARTGSAAAIQEILKSISSTDLLIILIAVILSSFISFFIGIKLSKLFSQNIAKINYSKLSILVIAVLILLNFFFTNFLGIVVLLTATSLGIFCILSSSRRINLMGSLIIPVIIFYLFG